MYAIKKPLFQPSQAAAAQLLLKTVCIVLLSVHTAVCAEGTSPKEAPETNTLTVSTFTRPLSLKEGRDPFHPLSTRHIDVVRPIPDPDVVIKGPAKLELKGISGSSDRPLALINNRTLAVGEEQDVSTPEGRVKVMCLAIEGTTVRIRAQGQTRELVLRKGI
jgi:hypothetical protein